MPAEVQYDFDTRSGSNVKFVAGDGPRVAVREAALRALRLLHRRLRLQYWRTPDVETLRRAGAMDAEVALSIPGYIHPDLMPLTNVLVMPDIQHEYCPEFFPGRELDERRRLYTQSAHRAAHICAISEFTRQTLIERLGIAPERVTTTRLAADPIFEPGSPARGDHRRVLDRYGLPSGQYLLFPGNTWPHKNHQGAVEALRVLREAYGLDPLLVCTGSPKGAEGELRAKIRAAGLEARVRFLGYCPTSDMPALYEGAAALVFPSLFEGFGIPLLEAMWCDCPIVCSNTTSLPEIAGDAALLVDPRSPEDLAHAMSRVLTDTATRQALIERGRRQVTGFSWQEFTLDDRVRPASSPTAPQRVGLPMAALPRISIVTACLDPTASLVETVESVVRQGYANLEHFIVTGGARDGILGRLARHPQVTLVSDPGRGRASALNMGFSLASGAIWAILDAGDCLLPGALDVAAREIDPTRGRHVVMGRCQIVDARGRVRRHRAPERPSRAIAGSSRSGEAIPFPSRPSSGLPRSGGRAGRWTRAWRRRGSTTTFVAASRGRIAFIGSTRCWRRRVCTRTRGRRRGPALKPSTPALRSAGGTGGRRFARCAGGSRCRFADIRSIGWRGRAGT